MWNYAEIQTVPDIVRHYGRTTPEKTAVIQGTRKVSYAQLDALSNQLARAMAARGAAPGSVIGYIGKNSLNFFEIVYAAGKAGCTLLPLNWRLVAAELGPILLDAKPAILFADKDLSALAGSVVQETGLSCELVEIDTGDENDTRLARWAADADHPR